ncbi:MAG: hypothetical protein KA524_01315 [Nitrosomonas sp.]|nr:hypothetical protein [Nitrosomonas sp.]MBP6074743.1 hypothetical protein [Nitrosomonas sp.]
MDITKTKIFFYVNKDYVAETLIIFKHSLLILLLWLISHTVSAARFDHAILDGLLRQHVYMINQGKASVVDYYEFVAYRSQLSKYLSQLSQVKKSDFSNWDKSEQLAFLTASRKSRGLAPELDSLQWR